MSNSCLVSVYHPGNVIAAISAVKWYNDNCDVDIKNITTIVHHPALEDHEAYESAEIVERMVKSHGWPKPILLTYNDVRDITSEDRRVTYREVLNRFRQKLGIDHFDQFFYAHDIVGRVQELSMNAYPMAKRITFGDALGSVYNKDLHLSLASGRPIKGRLMVRPFEISQLKKHFLNILYGMPKEFETDTAILVLPMDQTGKCLMDKQLTIIPKNFVLKIILSVYDSLPDLTRYCQQLLSEFPKPHYLMLLENISDGNFTSAENEVSLYKEVIENNIPKGSTVVIKAHPSSKAPIDHILSDKLKNDYRTVEISNDYKRFPIELWVDIIPDCEIISMSYPSISLSYLYSKPVIYPMNTSLIERYMPDRFWGSYKNADQMYRGQLENLKTWDGKSILWRGCQ